MKGMKEYITRERNISLGEMAKALDMGMEALIEKMRMDGYIQGHTQSLKARRLKIFFVERGVVRGSHGIYHERLNIKVTPAGKRYFEKKYGKP